MKLRLRNPSTTGDANWHLNFRVQEGLPDLKPIRTSFFVNLLFVTLAAGALLFTGHREFLAHNIRAEVAEATERVSAVSARNRQLLGLNKEFHDAAVVITSAEEFARSHTVASRLLVALSNSLPNSMDFSSIVYEEGRLVLRGSIRGASETSSSRVSAYLDVLRQDEVIGGQLPQISLTSLVRDPRTQGMTFEIVLKPGEATAES